MDPAKDGPSTPWWEAAPFRGSSDDTSPESCPESHLELHDGPSPVPLNFASVLSAAAAPVRREHALTWNEIDEAEDTASLSYESALRAEAGSRIGNRAELAPEAENHIDPKRNASVTIRLSEEENARLRERAAEAGLTVSAYLRSCTFEAETLRAQVKQALAELRAAAMEEKPFGPVSEGHAPHRWWRRRPHVESWSARA